MKKIIICDGGLGDSLILVGACRDRVDIAIRKAQIPLVSKLFNVDNAFDVHDPTFKARKDKLSEEYDEVIQSDMFMANFEQLYPLNYYKLAAKRLKQLEPAVPKLNIPLDPIQGTVAFHTTATNPNRHVDKSVWDQLAYSFSKAGWVVYFMGTSSDYGFADPKRRIYKVSDFEESLLGQAELLATCSLFVGVDSGFLHISGILGINGYCLLTNTGYNVLENYSQIKSIDNFDKLGLQPTHSLQPYCETSKFLADSITAEQVCKEIGIPCSSTYNKVDVSKKTTVRITDDPSNLLRPYLDGFRIVECDEDIHLTLRKDGSVLIEIGEHTDLFISHYLNLPRGIRNAVFAAGKERTHGLY